MGTSGAYGGSPRWKPVRDWTQQWLDELTNLTPNDPAAPPSPPNSPNDAPDVGRPTVSPAIASVISAIGRVLVSEGNSIGGGGGGSGGGGAPALAGVGVGRSPARAGAVGGRALGGAYGVRAGAAAPLGELGLDLAELTGLTRYQQAKRILDAALGPKGDVLDSELRKTNADVVLWALGQEIEPTPTELANRWVIEYVWEVWITESGLKLQEQSADPDKRLRAEQEMRATLEATVSAHGLPEGRVLSASDFSAAIEGALSSIQRIAGGES